MTINFEQKIEQARLKDLFQRHRWASSMMLILGLILLSLDYQNISTKHIIWYVGQSIISVWRALYCHNKFQIDDLDRKYETRYLVLCLIHGIFLGAIPFVFINSNDFYHIFAISLFPIGLISNITAVTTASQRIALPFVLLIAAIFSSYLAINLPTGKIVILFAATVFMLGIMKTIKEGHQMYMDNLRLTFEHKDTADELKEKWELEKKLKKQMQLNFEQTRMASLGRIAAGVAHEVNNPLTVIKARTHIMGQSLDKEKNFNREKFRKGIDEINSTVDRIAKIVQGLQYYSSDRKKSEQVEVFSLKNFISYYQANHYSKLMKKSIHLKVDDCLEEVSIRFNKVELSRVIDILIENSIDAIKEKDKNWVKLSYETNGKGTKLYIDDSGCGVPYKIRSSIMEPFFTTKETGEGVGLGLTIARAIVESYGGRLYYDEDVAHTRFVIDLPSQQDHLLIA